QLAGIGLGQAFAGGNGFGEFCGIHGCASFVNARNALARQAGAVQPAAGARRKNGQKWIDPAAR
ncbi:MAG TPA: hypothetical protein VFF98_02980, partial [Novosphingobium sp.]|nr:hypothetical protein [Novosphingobium sp.]